MSSFILDKKEFIKAAGIMCGIEESKRDKHQYFINNVKRRFEECADIVGHFFFVCMSKLAECTCSDIDGWWGEVEL